MFNYVPNTYMNVSACIYIYIYIYIYTHTRVCVCACIYIYIGGCLVWFYGISTIVGYLMLNFVYTYILNI